MTSINPAQSVETPTPPLAGAEPGESHKAKPTARSSEGNSKPPPSESEDAKKANKASNGSQPAHVGTENEDRVSSSGLIRMANVELISKVPLFYWADRSCWYGPNERGGFARFSDSQARTYVAEHGFHKGVKDAQGNTPAERATLWLAQNRSVSYAGPISGYPSGSHEISGVRVLVTDSPRMQEPSEGDFSTILELIESLFADEGQPFQSAVFIQWAAASFRALLEMLDAPGKATFRHCPAIAIFGPKGCGKSALIDLVLGPLFGGRKADPMNYLRESKFNKDLIGASLLVLDDKGASASLTERRQRGESIKNLIWTPDQRMEGKNADAIILRPFWRLVIAGNDDDGGLQVAPTLSPSLEDKLIILRARKATGLPESHPQKEAWCKAIRTELPAFAYFLLHYTPPKELALDGRSGVANFWHPEIVSALRDMQPEMRLLELIDSLNLAEPPFWEGSATEFEGQMRSKDQGRVLDRLFVSGTSAGRMLTELSKMVPDRIRRSERGGRSHYRIFPPKAQNGAETRE